MAVVDRGEETKRLEAARDKILALNVKLIEAKTARAKRFPRDDYAMNPEHMKALQEIDRLENELMWARRQLDLRQNMMTRRKRKTPEKAVRAFPSIAFSR